MDRNIKMEIELPEEQLENFRIFIVRHGGAIVKEDKIGNNIRNNRWIPVSERLPKKSGKYLVTVKNGNVYAGTYDEYSGRFQCAATAWMPLPQPYKAESEE